MTDVPLCSSRRALAALRRLGCKTRPGKGSHILIYREGPEGRKLTQTFVMGKNPIRRGTLRGILEGLGLSVEEFCKALR